MNGQPTRVSELFASKWLSAADLSKPVTVTVSDVSIQTLRQPDGTSEQKLVLSFERATKKMIVNATQAKALATALGDYFPEWVGARIKLGAASAQNGKQTIAVLLATPMPNRVPREANQAQPAPSQVASTESDPELWEK